MSETLGAETSVPINKGSSEQNTTEVGNEESEEAVWYSRDSQLCQQLAVCLWWLCPHLSFPNSKTKGTWWEKHIYGVSLYALPDIEFPADMRLPALLVMLSLASPFWPPRFFTRDVLLRKTGGTWHNIICCLPDSWIISSRLERSLFHFQIPVSNVSLALRSNTTELEGGIFS